MKKNYRITALASAICVISSVGSCFAATIIVDNNPNHTADYRTLQEAVDAAQAGDTILLGPSSAGASYGDATITKKLYIYGAGYLLGSNGYTGGDSKVGTIVFDVVLGSGNIVVSSSSGSIISSVDAYSIMVDKQDYGDYTYEIKDILIQRNQAQYIYVKNDEEYGKVHNITVINNHVSDISCSSSYATGMTVLVSGNIIYSSIYLSSGEFVVVNNSGKASYNAYYGTDGVIYNNIGTTFYKDDSSIINIHSNYVGNSSNLDSSVYISTGSGDARYKLKTDSLAKGACFNGADCGAFAGATPYILSGLPPRPRVTTFEVPAFVLKTDATMQVKVSAESRN